MFLSHLNEISGSCEKTGTIFSQLLFSNRSDDMDEGLTLETSAFLFFTVANLRLQLSG